MKCRECGALLVAPPVSSPVTPSPRFAPAPFTPVTASREPDAEKSGAPVVPILVAVLVVAFAAAVYATIRSGTGSGGASKTPVVLAPVDESRGLPSLSDAVRIQAESARQRAFAVVSQASATSGGAPLDAQTLRSLDPSLQWVAGGQSSTEPGVVSFSQSADGVIIAVSTKSRDVCAFGQSSPSAANRFVTLGNVRTCRAADAPSAGWSERGPTDGGSRYAPPDGY
jgi:hypothetical protein